MATKKKKGTDWSKMGPREVPRALLFLGVGASLRMKWGSAIVASVDSKGRPLTLDYRDAEGEKHMGVPVILEEYKG